MNLQEAMEKTDLGAVTATSGEITIWVYWLANPSHGQDVMIRLSKGDNFIGAMPGKHLTGTLTDYGQYSVAELARRAAQHGFTEWAAEQVPEAIK